MKQVLVSDAGRSRQEFVGLRFNWSVGITAMGLVLAMFVSANGQSTVPDAQVEANVLKALAGAPELATQSISTTTVNGVVTLNGTVQDETARVRAEKLAASAVGVARVIDQIQLSSLSPSASSQGGPGPGMVLQSDGSYAQAAPVTGTNASAITPQRNDPDNDQALDQKIEDQQSAQQSGAAPNSGQPSGGYSAQPAYPNGGNGGYPPPPQGNGSPQNYPQQQYPQMRSYPPNRYPQGAPWGGQVAGQPVSIPSGALLRIRVDRLIASDRVKVGETFEGFVASDVVADGFIAIPRGAAVQGKVVDAHASGVIKGRGELSIELTSVTLGGKVYPISSDLWAHDGADKTIQTINSAAGYGVAGALIGAIAGRGAGAAIGAGVGAAAGVGASAASPRGQVVIPPEGMVTFHLAQGLQLQTVSEQEIQRLSYGVPSGQGGRPLYGRPAYPAAYPPPYGYPAPY